MRLLLFISVAIWLILGLSSCKKDVNPNPDNHVTPKEEVQITIQLHQVDEFYQPSPVKIPLKVVTVDATTKDTVYIGYFDSTTVNSDRYNYSIFRNQAQIFPTLYPGDFITSVTDSTETYANAVNHHTVYGKKDKYSNTLLFQISKYPSYTVSVASIKDTIIELSTNPVTIGRAWLIDLNSTLVGDWATKNVPRCYVRFDTKPETLPIREKQFFAPEPILNGNRKYILPEYTVNDLKLKKGDIFYISVIETSAGAKVASLSQFASDSVYSNAVGKSVQNFKIVY